MNLSKCDICPRKCGINREKDELGFCQMKDKIKIARDHILPNMLEEYKINPDELSLTNKTITTIIRNYTEESGVRELERIIRKICRKYVCNKIDGKRKIDPNKNLENISSPEDTIYIIY